MNDPVPAAEQGVLILGASGGVGQVLARHYADAGVATHLAGRDVAALASELGAGHSGPSTCGLPQQASPPETNARGVPGGNS